jgi:hypothetical protein
MGWRDQNLWFSGLWILTCTHVATATFRRSLCSRTIKSWTKHLEILFHQEPQNYSLHIPHVCFQKMRTQFCDSKAPTVRTHCLCITAEGRFPSSYHSKSRTMCGWSICLPRISFRRGDLEWRVGTFGYPTCPWKICLCEKKPVLTPKNCLEGI